MLPKIKEYFLSLFREPDFQNRSGIFMTETGLLERFIAVAETTPTTLWEKRSGIGIEDWATTIRYDTKIEASFLNPNQGYRDHQKSYQLRIEEKTERDQPTELFRHPDKTYYSFMLLEEVREVGSVQGKKIKQLFDALDKKEIEDLSLAPFKNITAGLPSAPQKGDLVSLSEALNNLKLSKT